MFKPYSTPLFPPRRSSDLVADRALRPGVGDAHRACHRPQRVAELGVGFGIIAVADSVLPIGVEIIGKADVELRAGGDIAAPSGLKIDLGMAVERAVLARRGPGAGVEAAVMSERDRALHVHVLDGPGNAATAKHGAEADATRHPETRSAERPVGQELGRTLKIRWY